MGCGQALVGRSHDWDSRRDAAAIPAVSEKGNGGQPALDTKRLRSLAPDVVVVSRSFGECSGLHQRNYAELNDLIGPDRTVSFDPHTFKQVLDSVLAVALRAGIFEEAMAYIAAMELQLGRAQRQRGIPSRDRMEPRLRVLCLESIRPLVVAGRWLPDLVELAGGTAVLNPSKAESRGVTWSEISEAQPESIVASEEDSSGESALLRALASHDIKVPVVRLPGRSFAEPGPQLYESAQALVRALPEQE